MDFSKDVFELDLLIVAGTFVVELGFVFDLVAVVAVLLRIIVKSYKSCTTKPLL